MLSLIAAPFVGFHASAPLPAGATARAGAVSMGSAAAFAKKAAVVEEIQAAMEPAALMFCVRSEGIKVNDMNMMRQKFGDDVTVRCVKNTLIKRAVEDYPRFQGGDSLLEYSNYWFFVPEDGMRDAYKTWDDWVKETKRVSSLDPTRVIRRAAAVAAAGVWRLWP